MSATNGARSASGAVPAAKVSAPSSRARCKLARYLAQNTIESAFTGNRNAARPRIPRAVARQRTARHQTVNVYVVRQGWSPRVEDGRDADRPAQMPWIAAEGEQRVGGRPEEERVDHARIARRECIERPDLRVPRQLKVPRRGTQMTVPQQALDRVEVDTGFQ